MNDPIFVRTYNDEGKIRDSYRDYWYLVQLSKFPTCELDEVERNSDKVYIFSPDDGNVKAFCEVPHKAKYILWQLERPGKIDNIVPSYFDEMWVSDRHFKTLVNDLKCKYVILGGHPDFGIYSFDEPKEYDYAHISYEYGRRHELYQKFRNKGATLAPNGWGAERDKILRSSKAMLCFHQDDEPIIEPLRYLIAACYGLPIVTEHSADTYPYLVILLDEDYKLEDNKTRKYNARNNFILMTEESTFRHAVECNV